MTKIKIEYYQNICVGTLNCIQEDSAHFRADESNFAVLIGGKEEITEGVFALIRDLDEEGIKKAVSAAESCPVNAIRISEAESGKVLYDTNVKEQGSKTIIAEYNDAKEFKLDPKGYFLIRINPDKKEIELGFCERPNEVKYVIKGKKPIDIYQTILREKIIDRPDHAAYIGRETQKAYIAIQLGLEYVQDDELDFSKLNK